MLLIKNNNFLLVIALLGSVLLHLAIIWFLFLREGAVSINPLAENNRVIMTDLMPQEALEKKFAPQKPATLHISSQVANNNKSKKTSNTKLETNSANKADLKSGKKIDSSKEASQKKQEASDTKGMSEKEQAKQEAQMSSMFLKKMDTAIKENWIRPGNISEKDDLIVVLNMRLNPDGTLNDITITKSSGNELFDRSAIASISKIGKFAVPSDNSTFKKHFELITINFSNL